jgi:hypothetical protein
MHVIMHIEMIRPVDVLFLLKYLSNHFLVSYPVPDVNFNHAVLLAWMFSAVHFGNKSEYFPSGCS